MFYDLLCMKIPYYTPGEFVVSIRDAFLAFGDKPWYVIINWLFLFSFLGYILECIVLSIENRKKITNRGFCHLPICIIYGICGVLAAGLLGPFVEYPVFLFIVSAILATTAELVTANIMVMLFDGFWWDYSNKKFNYRGMISLETSLGWGLVGLIFTYFLRAAMFNAVCIPPVLLQKLFAVCITIIYIADFTLCAHKRLTGQESDLDSVGRKTVKKDIDSEENK